MNFYTPSINDKEKVDKYMKPYGENSCQHSFTNIFSLAEKYNDQICEKDGFLFVLRSNLCCEGKRVYLAPAGSGDRKQAYSDIIEDAHKHGSKVEFFTLTPSQKEFIESEFPGVFKAVELRDYAEYIYDSQSLHDMAGKEHADNRQMANKFVRDYGDRTELKIIQHSDFPEILQYVQKWISENFENHDNVALTREYNSIKKHLDNYDVLGITGIVIRIDGEIKGFNYGAALNSDCYDGLVCKADRDIKNIYKYIYREAAQMLYSPYKYSNWEEDVGIPGLREFKMSYHPCKILSKYLVDEL